jgi:putative intracellular protease/amidase
MRRLPYALVIVAALLLAGFSAVQAAKSEKVFMFVSDGSRDLDLMLEKEVGVMQQMLEAAGYSVEIATASGQAMVAETVTLTPSVRLEDVVVADYAGVILPCMAPAAGHVVPKAVEHIMAQAIALGKPVAASRGSVVTLAKAGGVRDRQYAFAARVDTVARPEFAGGEYLGTGVVRDGNVSTAGICPLAARELAQPDGTADLTRAFIESLSDAG